MSYLVQVVLYTALMCLVYVLLLRNRLIHGFNRFYLLSCAVLPFFIPLADIPPLFGERFRPLAGIHISLPEYMVGGQDVGAFRNMPGIIRVMYMWACIAIAAIAVYNLLAIRRTIKKGVTEKKTGYLLVRNSGIGPGSWFSYIFLPGSEVHEAILAHEIAHIRLKHSYDILLLTLCNIILWPNLLLVWIRKELLQVHEFQADGYAVAHACDDDYTALLLANIFGRRTLPQIHSFIVHPIKRRIMMLKKKDQNRQAYMGSIAVATAIILVLCSALAIQGCKTRDLNVLTRAEKMPQFDGDLVTYLGNTIKYPDDAKQKGIEGKVLVRFVVNEKGEIVDAMIKSSPDETLSKSALEVVQKMPRWIPGEDKGKKVAVEYTLPILYKLS